MSTLTVSNPKSPSVAGEFEQVFQEHQPPDLSDGVWRHRKSRGCRRYPSNDFSAIASGGNSRRICRETPGAISTGLPSIFRSIRSGRVGVKVLVDDAESLDLLASSNSGPTTSCTAGCMQRSRNWNPEAAQTLVLRYIHNYSDAEIAKMLGTSRTVIAVRLFRSRARLRKILRRKFMKSDQEIVERSLARYSNPSTDQVESAVARVWKDIAAEVHKSSDGAAFPLCRRAARVEIAMDCADRRRGSPGCGHCLGSHRAKHCPFERAFGFS